MWNEESAHNLRGTMNSFSAGRRTRTSIVGSGPQASQGSGGSPTGAGAPRRAAPRRPPPARPSIASPPTPAAGRSGPTAGCAGGSPPGSSALTGAGGGAACTAGQGGWAREASRTRSACAPDKLQQRVPIPQVRLARLALRLRGAGGGSTMSRLEASGRRPRPGTGSRPPFFGQPCRWRDLDHSSTNRAGSRGSAVPPAWSGPGARRPWLPPTAQGCPQARFLVALPSVRDPPGSCSPSAGGDEGRRAFRPILAGWRPVAGRRRNPADGAPTASTAPGCARGR